VGIAMSEQDFSRRALELTLKAELLDKQGLSEELNELTFDERMKLVQEMDRLNAGHRQTDPDLPDLTFEVKKDMAGQDHVVDIQMRKERSWWNPLRWFGFKYASKDVYDPPCQGLGEALIGQTCDRIHSHYRQLEEDLSR
jgi:hypothetical protein